MIKLYFLNENGLIFMLEDYYSIQLYNGYPDNGAIVLTGGTVFYDKK
ncbi:hypothetical protein OCA15_22675 [Bacillus cereus]|nr:hypothetical protein [Bacillus cereus]